MALITGGQAIIRTLRELGVDMVFGIPGDHTVALYDALYQDGTIRHVLARHEQGAAFMAQGYGMTSGKVGVSFATTGPGVFNAITALAEAYGDSSRVLMITSEIDRPYIGKFKGVSHESKDQLGVLERVTGWAAQADSVEAIPGLIHEAFKRMHSGRPRPTAIQFPKDILQASVEESALSAAAVSGDGSQPAPSRADIQKAARLLAEAEHPIIWAGGGVNIAGANDELGQIAELLSAPVITSMQGKGAIPEDHPLALGNWGEHAIPLLERSDAGLAIGARFTYWGTKFWKLPIPRRLVQVDIDAEEIGKNFPAELGLVGDAKLVLGQLLDELRALGVPDRPQVYEKVRRLRDDVLEEVRADRETELELVKAMRAALAKDAIVFTDTAIGNMWVRDFLPVYSPRSFFGAGGFSTLGFAVPAAMGAKAAFPDRQVVAACGDGSFMFCCQELGTAVQENLPLAIIVFNNHAHQMIKDQQTRNYGGRYIGVELKQPDFVELARVFGLAGFRVDSADQMKLALEAALAGGKPALLDVTVPIRRTI